MHMQRSCFAPYTGASILNVLSQLVASLVADTVLTPLSIVASLL